MPPVVPPVLPLPPGAGVHVSHQIRMPPVRTQYTLALIVTLLSTMG